MKKLRTLQAAKHALSSFVRSLYVQQFDNKQPSSSSTNTPINNRITNRSPASPGPSAPIILFVLYDDTSSDNSCSDITSDNMNKPTNTMDHKDTVSKGSFSTMLRPQAYSSSNKADCSGKKKLQSSLDAQIRFLIKRCRVLTGSGSEHNSRGLGNSSSTITIPLFALDASRVVALLDRSVCHRGQILDFISSSMEKDTNLDMMMFENKNSNNEDIQLIKEFIYRQSDILRGKVGFPSNSATCGGVSMAAAAAAAAAASTSFVNVKSINVPELPCLDKWLVFSSLIGNELINVEHSQMSSRLGSNAASSEAALSCLESSVSLNKNFSVAWCKRKLPIAKEIYLKGLPACYPSNLHHSQLEKALNVFRSMVNGPAVDMYVKKLEDECTQIWISGRQRCDAVSLTGNSCMHQRHSTDDKKHSSGYFFLHACACGRSRCLWDDPFDINDINVDLNCKNDLPTLVLPKETSSFWKLVRIGGARYYKPTKGVLQVGFCSMENFLLKWEISVEKKNGVHALEVTSVINPTFDSSKFSNEPENDKKLFKDTVSSDEANISFGKGLPSFTMKKQFSEVVAGISNVDSTFPALKNNKQLKVPPPVKGSVQVEGQMHKSSSDHNGQTNGVVKVKEILSRPITNHQANANSSFLQIGSNLVPMSSEKSVANTSTKKVTVYVGFEHECSYGHRFLLSPKHLMELTSSCYTESSEEKAVESNRIMEEEIEGKLSHVTLDDGNSAFSLLNRNLPMYMNCPHCKGLTKQNNQDIQFASTVSQLQRIFLVTPPFPTILATCPVIQFNENCLAQSTPISEKKLTFTLGNRVILPPDSFLTLRLPFVYGIENGEGTTQALRYLKHQPDLSAWLVKGTALQIISTGNETDETSRT